MAQLANLHAVTNSLTITPKVHAFQTTSTKLRKINCLSQNIEDRHSEKQCTLPFNSTTRRSILGLASVTLLAHVGEKTTLAQENNGLWLDGPLPGLPPAVNKIANAETGTRSFVYRGIYVANVGKFGRAHRLKKNAFDLMALGDLIGQDAWNYIRKYLRLKGTVMYYDFDELISAAPVSDKQPLTDLANRLFDNFEKLQDAVKMKDLPLTKSRYSDTTVILQEVMDRMA